MTNPMDVANIIGDKRKLDKEMREATISKEPAPKKNEKPLDMSYFTFLAAMKQINVEDSGALTMEVDVPAWVIMANEVALLDAEVKAQQHILEIKMQVEQINLILENAEHMLTQIKRLRSEVMLAAAVKKVVKSE